jgi:hypothetical protein
MTSAQIASLQSALQDNNIAQIVQAVTGAYAPSGGSAFSQLESWAEGIYTDISNYVESLASSLTGIETAVWNDITEVFSDVEDWAKQLWGGVQQLQTWWNSLINGLLGSSGGGGAGTVYDLTSWLQNAEQAAQAALNQWAMTLDGLLGTGSDITDFVEWLDGSASGSMLTGVSSSTITAANAQLLGNPNFSGVISLDGNGIWTYDSTVYYTQAGVVSPGSAKVTANGVLQAITSDQAGSIANPIPLGQPIDYSVQVLTSGLTGTGTLLQLLAVPWIGNAQQTPVVIASGGMPGGSNATWTNPPSGSHAATLSGSYSPATGSGITSVQMRLAVTANATAGTVWYSAASEELTGGLIATLQSDFTAGNTAFSTLWTSWETAVAGYTGWPTFIAAMESAYSTYITTTTALTAGEFATLQQLIGSLVGINTSTGFMPATNVTNTLGQSSLGADVQAILDYIANALGHSGTGHTLTNIETYLGLIPPANVTNVLGGSNLGADVSAVNSSATTMNTWWNRFMLDLTIYLDLFHVTYPAGSPSDTKTTTIGGKRTWYSAIADILDLFGVVTSTTAPANPAADLGTTVTGNTTSIATNATNITAAQASATTAGTNASTAIANAAAANTLAQGTVDGLYQAFNGGTSTGNPVSTVRPGASNIPASNVQGIAAATVTYGNAGSNFALGASLSFPFTPASTDTFVVAVIPWYSASSSVGTSTCTYGGTSMTLVTQLVGSSYSGDYLKKDLFILKIAAGGGAKTVAWANSAAGGVDGAVMSFFAQKLLNYGSSGGGISSSAALTMSYTSTASSPTSNRVVAAFSEIGSSKATWSGFTPGTVHVNNGPTGSSGGVGLYAGDVAGSVSALNFSATHGMTGGPAGQWLGFTLELSN